MREGIIKAVCLLAVAAMSIAGTALTGSTETNDPTGAPLTKSWPPYGPMRLMDLAEYRGMLERSHPSGGMVREVTLFENGIPVHADRFEVPRAYFDDRLRLPLQRCLDELEPRMQRPSADLDSDGDVDQDDFGIMQRCMSGAGVPKRAGC